MTFRVEMEYRLLLAIDMSLYGYKKIIKIIFGGCAKFHPLAFLLSKVGVDNADMKSVEAQASNFICTIATYVRQQDRILL